MIKAIKIFKSYKNVKVLKGVSLEVKEGEIVSILGASGAGKTTLLNILGTLDKADKGKLIINNVEIDKLKDKKISFFRNKNIGFVFQFHHLLPEFTAFENVCIPAFISNNDKKNIEERAMSLLDELGLSKRKNHKPSELSGGEQQRVAIARALINNPKIIIADEPSGNLDSKNSKELYKLFLSLREKYMQSFIIATHNKELAKITDKQYTIVDGKIIS